MRKIKYTIGVVFFLVLISAVFVFASNTEIIHLKEAPPPDKTIFSIAQDVITNYKINLEKLGTKNCSLEIDPVNGIIETNWHPIHKGERHSKIQIYVWGPLYRIDVWHRPTIALIKRPFKDYMCRLEEMQLQQQIEEKIKNP